MWSVEWGMLLVHTTYQNYTYTENADFRYTAGYRIGGLIKSIAKKAHQRTHMKTNGVFVAVGLFIFFFYVHVFLGIRLKKITYHHTGVVHVYNADVFVTTILFRRTIIIERYRLRRGTRGGGKTSDRKTPRDVVRGRTTGERTARTRVLITFDDRSLRPGRLSRFGHGGNAVGPADERRVVRKYFALTIWWRRLVRRRRRVARGRDTETLLMRRARSRRDGGAILRYKRATAVAGTRRARVVL